MAIINLTSEAMHNQEFVEQVIRDSGENIRDCYQCGKCSAGCPIAFAMDYRPNRILRMLQLGMKDQVLNSKSIWICATCSTCTARCPKDVDLARVMDTLRIMAKKEGKYAKAKSAVIFHEEFMKSVLKYGRTYELGLAIGLNVRNMDLFKDAELSLPMLTKGKLKFLPPKIKGAEEVRQIMARAERLEGESH